MRWPCSGLPGPRSFRATTPSGNRLSRTRYANWLRHVWTPEGWTEIPGFRQGQDRFRQLAFSPDGNYLLAIASVGDCLLWDRPRGRVVPLTGPAAGARPPPGNRRPDCWRSAAEMGRSACWLRRPLRRRGTAGRGRCGGPGIQPRRPPTGLGRYQRPRIWDRETKRYSTPLLEHGGPVVTLAFSADGAMLATSARDLKARVFRVASEKPSPLFPPLPHVLAEYGINHGGPDALRRALPTAIASC